MSLASASHRSCHLVISASNCQQAPHIASTSYPQPSLPLPVISQTSCHLHFSSASHCHVSWHLSFLPDRLIVTLLWHLCCPYIVVAILLLSSLLPPPSTTNKRLPLSLHSIPQAYDIVWHPCVIFVITIIFTIVVVIALPCPHGGIVPPPLVIAPSASHGHASTWCGLGGTNTVALVEPLYNELMGEGVVEVVVRLPLLSILLWISVASLHRDGHNHLPI